MTAQPEWLPPLVTLESCGGDWPVYLNRVYGYFRSDFISNKVSFNGLPVNLRRYPLVQNMESSFWHLVSEGAQEEDRIPNIRRCERICWPRPIIENAEDARIKQWKNDRQGQSNICLWLEEQEYIVILGERSGYNLLLTAYTVTWGHTKRRFASEYEAYLAKG